MVCLLLCVALVWGYSYKEPTKAHATSVVLGIEGGVVVYLVLSALGINIAGSVSNDAVNSFCSELWRQVPGDMKQDVKSVENVCYCTPALFEWVANQVKFYTDIKGNVKLMTELPDHKLDYVGNPVAPGCWESFYKELFGMTTYDCELSSVSASASPARDDISGIYILGTFPEAYGTQYYNMRFGRVAVEYISGSAGSDGSLYNIRFGDIKSTVTLPEFGYLYATHNANYILMYNNPQLRKFVLVKYMYGDKSGYAVLSPAWNGFMWVNLTDTASVSALETAIPADKWQSQGKSAYNNDVKSIEDAIEQAQKAKGLLGTSNSGATAYGLKNTGSNTKVDDNTRGQSQSTTTGYEATAADEAANAETNTTQDTSLPKPVDMPDLSLPELVTKKFPFSLPWDLYLAVSNLVAPPKAPVWDIPLKFDAVKVNYTMHIDMSQFDGIATVSRWGLSVLFTIGLIMATKKLIGG